MTAATGRAGASGGSGTGEGAGFGFGPGGTDGLDARIVRAGQCYERAVFGGDGRELARSERELDAVEADLAVARGRILHARFLEQRIEQSGELALFERAAELYRALGDLRGEGEAMFWIGVFHQVVRGDGEAALPALALSRELAEQADDRLTLSYALRHLGIAEHMAGRLGPARQRLEESVRLRRELDFPAGVAANLVGLAYLSMAEGRPEAARELLAEAGRLASASGAHGVLHSVAQACAQLGIG
ncbi:tetratricopeptide repeat protein [Kitasatospora sp. NPDC004240]